MEKYHQKAVALRVSTVRDELDVIAFCLQDDALSGSMLHGMQSILNELSEELTEIEAYLEYGPGKPKPEKVSNVVHGVPFID